MKKIINGIEIELTQEEIIQRKLDEQQAEQDRLAKLAKEEQEKANKQSAINKLKALGLTDAEVEAFKN